MKAHTHFLVLMAALAPVMGLTSPAGAAVLPGASADGLWRVADASSLSGPGGDRIIVPRKYRTIRLDHDAFRSLTGRAPMEYTEAAKRSPIEITLPMPDGKFARFRIEESPIMDPALARQFPEIRTFRGQGIDDPSATTRFGWTSAGFHAIVFGTEGTAYIDPYRRGDTEIYTTYFKKDYERSRDLPPFHCLVDGQSTFSGPLRPHRDAGASLSGTVSPLASNGTMLRTYRLALAANGEYTQFHGGTKALALNNGIVPAMNRVNGVYERELAIRMVLIPNELDIIFEQPLADPYVNEDGTSMLAVNQVVLDGLIGSANYDIGHVFSTGGGGVAGLGVVCDDLVKGRGVTGLPQPTGDAFWIDFVAHEMGHEFGGNHTFNGETGNCSGNRNASTAWEPGSGSTIMPYAGICGSEDLQPHSDDYFHTGSLDEIVAYSVTDIGNDCPVKTLTGNTPPTVDAGPTFTIPARTPFTLTATGSDADGDPITYCWEEFDLGTASPPNDDVAAIRPILRSFAPVTSPSRTFPKLSDILAATETFGESLPTRSRTMQFRVTARDNRVAGGGIVSDLTSVTVADTAGPFVVTSPQTPVTWTTSSTRTVTWNVANTESAPVSAANVNILLSTDGGNSFPITLQADTPNDGTQLVTVPVVTTSAARVRVEAAGNIFFDISDVNFTINPAAPAILTDGASLSAESCAPVNGAVDPDETVTVNFALENLGTANATDLVATLLPTGGVSLPSAPQSYGALQVGGASQVRAFTFKAEGACGGAIDATLALQDDGANLGTVVFTIPLGQATSTSSAFSSALPVTIPPQGPAVPYPASITVSGVAGSVSKVTVTLTGLEHPYPDDLDILLVGPGGQTVMLMSDAGGGGALTGASLTFDDEAAEFLPDNSMIAPGAYKPTDIGTTENLLPPAPQRPYGTVLSAFNGLDANGTWSLYAADDAAPDNGSIAGWTLTVSTRDVACCGFFNPKEASPGGDMRASRGTGTSVDVAYTPACGASDHVIYMGVGPISGAPSWTAARCGAGATGTASFDPGQAGPGQVIYFVIVGQNGAEEGSYGRSSSGAERPEAAGIGVCERPQDLSGSCP